MNKVFKVEANVIKKGEVRIENVTGEIFLPSELLLSGKKTKNIGIVLAGKEKKINWSVKGESTGSYIIVVSVLGVVNNDIVTAEGGSKLVTIVEKVPPPDRLPNIFERFFDFIGKWFGQSI